MLLALNFKGCRNCKWLDVVGCLEVEYLRAKIQDYHVISVNFVGPGGLIALVAVEVAVLWQLDAR